MSTSLQAHSIEAENAALRNRVEDLEFELAEIRGTSNDSHIRILRIKLHYGIEPAAAKLLYFMRDGRHHSREVLEDAMRRKAEYSGTNVLSVQISRLRKRRGFTIRPIWGFGYQLNAADAAEIRRIAEGQQA